MPSLLLPIKYSSLILIIASLASVYNIFSNKKTERSFNYLWIPFLIYFLSIIITFFIDFFNGQIVGEFISRNVSVLIIPLFIFTSNFSKTQILKILKKTSILITLVGVIFLVFWVFGYYKYSNQQEFQKEDWFKKELITSKNYISKQSIYNVTIRSDAKKPSLRKVIMLTDEEKEKSVIREVTLKVDESVKKDVWILLRNVNDDDKAWFNVTNGKIGKVEGESKVNSEKLFDDFFKFSFSNKPKNNATREWFYVSFVSDNGSYSWNHDFKHNCTLYLKEPNLYLDSGKNLLLHINIFKYKITDFSVLKNYAHSTYLGLVFTFALIIFIFNSFLKNYLRLIAIGLNVFFLITLASKAIVISLFFIIPIYFLYHFFNYKYLLLVIFIGFFIGFNSHVKERFNDMYKTVININNTEKLGDLKSLSTHNRIIIYKDYFHLIKENYLLGYGYQNGINIVKSKYNYTFNSHNQYLQSLFHSGFIGFLLLILFTFSPFILKRKKGKEKHGLEIIIVLILFNFLFESILSRQWGLIFVCFSYSIYFKFFKSELKWFR